MRSRLVHLVVVLFSFLPTGLASAQSISVPGRLAYVWRDDFASGAASFHLYLSADDGSVSRLELGPAAQRPYEELVRMSGRRVVANASVAASPSSGQRERVLQVDSLELVSAAQADAPLPDVVNGSQPWVTILCRFADFSGLTPPVNQSVFTGSSYPSLDEYWRETSYNAINTTGSTVVGWFNLPQPRSYYVYDTNGDGKGDADFGRLADDCTAAADATINFNDYVGFNLVFNQPTNDAGFFYGGQWSMTLDGTSKAWRTTWSYASNQYGLTGFSAFAHEEGHGFGFPHSSGSYGAVYDSN